MTQASSSAPAAGRSGRRVGSRKEDWIAEQLRHAYDEALEEAIPDEMLALLAQLDDKPEGGGEDRS